MQPQKKAQNKVQNKNFVKYPSIENSHNMKIVSQTKNSNVAKQNVVWVALQKIHGSNFSIQITEKTAIYCRRKDYVSKPIPIPTENVKPYFIEKFMNCEKLVETFHNKLGTIYKVLKQKFQNLQTFYLFGQYFGGFWPNLVKDDTPHVQKGVYYSPDHHFFIFDCLIKDNRWLSVKQLQQLINPIMPITPVYKTGTFQQMLNINNLFDSTIPKILGLQLKQKNTCEGVVIRPYQLPNHTIYKIKNDQFLEVTKKPIPKQQRQKAKQFTQSQILYQQLCNYLNTNRIASAYSKMPDAKIDTLVAQIIDDIFEDAQKNNLELIKNEQTMKKVTHKLKIKTSIETAKYLKDMRDTKQDQKQIIQKLEETKL